MVFRSRTAAALNAPASARDERVGRTSSARRFRSPVEARQGWTIAIEPWIARRCLTVTRHLKQGHRAL